MSGNLNVVTLTKVAALVTIMFATAPDGAFASPALPATASAVAPGSGMDVASASSVAFHSTRSDAGADPGPAVHAEIATRTVRDDRFPITIAHFDDGVVGLPGIVYSTLRGYRPLELDLYSQDTAQASVGPRALVVWVHGGGWDQGDARANAAFANFPAVLASLAARGYIVASVNYRLSGEARFPAAVQDVKAAIRYLRAHAAQYGVDPGRVMVWGGSAGGQLAALVAASCGVHAFEPSVASGASAHGVSATSMASSAPIGSTSSTSWSGATSQAKLESPERAGASGVPQSGTTESQESDCVQGAVIWYGVFDFEALAATPTRLRPSTVSAYLGCDPRSCTDVASSAGAITHVDRNTPPMLLIHGTADKEVPVTQTEAMAARLRAAGVPVETLYISGADHGWIGATPEATRTASLQALQRTFDFIDTAVGAKVR